VHLRGPGRIPCGVPERDMDGVNGDSGRWQPSWRSQSTASLTQRRVHDGERMRAGHVAHLGHSDQAPSPCLGDLHGPRGWRAPWCRPRERGRHRGVEADLALNLPKHLVDMAVEDGD
jgi:hypothetical protein